MNNKIAGVILAAGESRRFGQPKQLIAINGEFLINRIIRIASNSQLDPIILVLGAYYEKILGELKILKPITIVHNKKWKLGQSSSLIQGLDHINKDNSGIMFLLGDQPFITSEFINELISFYETTQKDVVMSQTNGKKTPPIIFSPKCYTAIGKLEGDRGAREIINNFNAAYFENKDELLLTDIDTEKDYSLIKFRIAIK